MSRISWFLTVGFAIFGTVGWYKALQKDQKQQITKQNREELVREIVSQKELYSVPPSQNDSSKLDAQTVQVCMSDPQIQQKIEAKAKLWAEEISNQVLEEYKEEEQRKKQEKVTEYMNSLEDFFLNSVNQYAEEFSVEAEVSDQLHQIVEHGFEKQRELYRRKAAGEISEMELRRLQGEAKAEDREAIVELLGEEGAEDFGEILREEGARAKQEAAQSDDGGKQ